MLVLDIMMKSGNAKMRRIHGYKESNLYCIVVFIVTQNIFPSSCDQEILSSKFRKNLHGSNTLKINNPRITKSTTMADRESRSTTLEPEPSAKVESFKVSRKTARPLKDENNYPAWTVDVQRILRLLKLKNALDETKKIIYSNEDEWQDLSDKA